MSKYQSTKLRGTQKVDREKLKRIIEAFLFVSVEPLDLQRIKDAAGEQDPAVIKELINEIRAEYAGSECSLRVEEIAGGYRMTTDAEYASYIKRLLHGSQKDRLSRASLETLAIVAYKQPVTRGEIEGIRGVNVDRALSTLLERGLVRIVGRKETVGRPILYGTTRTFLDHFGLKTLDDLPSLEEFIVRELSEEDKEAIRQKFGDEAVSALDAGGIDAALPKEAQIKETQDDSQETARPDR